MSTLSSHMNTETPAHKADRDSDPNSKGELRASGGPAKSGVCNSDRGKVSGRDRREHRRGPRARHDRKYPDGLAYDPRRKTVWTTNESAGTETVVDAATLHPRGTVELGGEVGNVGYDQDNDRMLVAVQGNNDLAVIDPESLTIVRRLALPGCQHPHGLAVDTPDRLVFVACDQNATLVTVDHSTWGVIGTNPVGQDPDVLAYDSAAHRLYVAAESGTLTTLDLHYHSLAVTGSGHLAGRAHVVAVDPTTRRSYYPVPAGANGHPALLVREPS
jgi:DNA-binding beta-propeller fold protein YncE